MQYCFVSVVFFAVALGLVVGEDVDCKKVPQSINDDVQGDLCCEMEGKGKPDYEPSKMMSTLKSALTECGEVFRKASNESEGSVDGFTCLNECVAVKTGLLNDDRTEFDDDKVEDLAEAYLAAESPKDLKDVGVKAAKKCLDLPMIDDAKDVRKVLCDKEAMQVLGLCFRWGIEAKCPKSRFNSSDTCAERREFFKECLPEIVEASMKRISKQ